LSFSDSFPATVLEVLSPNINMEEAARNLFAAMRRLDTSGVEKIYAQLLPEEGLGRAVNDRLRRAAG
jgi:L-threonylcarbamoyladenylate synthase